MNTLIQLQKAFLDKIVWQSLPQPIGVYADDICVPLVKKVSASKLGYAYCWGLQQRSYSLDGEGSCEWLYVALIFQGVFLNKVFLKPINLAPDLKWT